MQNKYINLINSSLKNLFLNKDLVSAISVCNYLLKYMGFDTRESEDIELSKLKLPNSVRYDSWFAQHPHFRSDRACFNLLGKNDLLEAKLYSLKKRSKLVIAGAVNFTPNYEDRDYTRNDPSMRVGLDLFLTPQNKSILVVLSNRGMLRLVELSERITNTQFEIFKLWENIAQTKDLNAFHTIIWDSFKLSSLNKKFYEGIAERFITLTQHLKNNQIEEQPANQFTNRLLGRLLFLWFLRKKNIINESKGYFDIDDLDDTDYYEKKLVTLFFKVLNNENHSNLDSITPYLNGGLFDEDADGDYWKKHKISFPKGFFHGLYEHFDSFNFTTDESTPEYEQIAIDPEMLGRIFESFLATLKTETGAQAKKANGAFYTPREIVSYMCKETLRQYLYDSLGRSSRTLIESVDKLLDYSNSRWALAGSNSKRDAFTKTDANKIKKALDNLTILDPAVGSGAFPMGMLHQILNLYERLDSSSHFNVYECKLNILRKNIYGVDIDPTAIEISRLRAWLSLVVEVEDNRDIKPLPNLDFKFVCANTLIELENSSQLKFCVDKNLKEELIKIRDKYYSTSDLKQKKNLQNKYIKLTHQSSIFDDLRAKQLKSYSPFDDNQSTNFYDPELMHGVGSFDIVIGNPPYIKEYTYKEAFKDLKKDPYYEGKMDLWYLFGCKCLDLMKDNSHQCFIATNNWVTNKGASKLRNKIAKDAMIIEFIDFNNYKIFESADVQTMVYLLRKDSSQDSYEMSIKKVSNESFKSLDLNLFLNENDSALGEFYDYEFKRDSHIDRVFNFTGGEILGILERISNKADFYLSKEEVATGIDVHQDFLNKKNQKILGHGFSVGDGIFILSNEEKKNLNLTKEESEVIKPYYTTKELHRYFGVSENEYWIIYLGSNGNKIIDKYPNIKKHLDKFTSVITSDFAPYGLHRARKEDFFKGEKIISLRKCPRRPTFTYVDFDAYVAQTFFVIKSKRINLKYLTALLNSNIIWFWLKFRGKMQGLNYQVDKEPLINIPIVNLKDNQILNKLIEQVDMIFKEYSVNDSSIDKIEKNINMMVYSLYDLSQQDIQIIENELSK